MSSGCTRGDSVTFKHDSYEGTAIVKFFGYLPAKSGLWVGLERDEMDPNESQHPEGFDGKSGEIQYFECKDSKGILVPYDAIQVILEEETCNAEPIDMNVDTSNPNDSEDLEPRSNAIHKGTSKPQKRRTKPEPIDARELALKIKRTVRTQTDKRMLQLKAETDKRISQLKQKQSDLTFRIKQRGDALKKKEIRDSLSINPNQPPPQTSIKSSISNRTAQLLHQQKLLSQAVSVHRKQFVTQQVKSKENIEVTLDEEQLKAIDTMSNIFMTQTKQSLDLVVDDIQELQLRQEKCLQNISKSGIWFTKEERQRLNEMSLAMDKVPKYRKKLTAMRQRVQDINWTVDKLKRDTAHLKAKIGIKD